MSKELSQQISAAIQEFSQPIQISRTMRPTEYELDGQTYSLDNVEYTVTESFQPSNLNDEFMVSEANPEEVDQILEGWLKGLESHFVSPVDSQVAKEYEVEQPLRPRTARMMAYTALANEYSSLEDVEEFVVHEFDQQRNNRRNEINIAVKNNQISKGKGEQQRQRVEKEFSDNVTIPLMQKEKYKLIQNFIARKFISELFSGSIAEDDFTLTPESFISTVRDIRSLPIPATQFINKVGTYLQNPKDSYFLNNYSYKEHSSLSSRVQDSQALSLGIQLALDTSENPDELSSEIKNLGESYISFIAQQAGLKSQRFGAYNDKYPILTTFYDLLNSSFQVVNHHSYKNSLGVLIEKTMGKFLGSSLAKQECTYLVENYFKEVESLLANNRTDMARLKNYKIRFDQLPQPIVQFVTSDMKRLFDGMRIALGSIFTLGDQDGPYRPSNGIKSLYESFNQQLSRKKGGLDIAINADQYFLHIANATMYQHFGIETDLTYSRPTFRSIPSDEQLKALTAAINNKHTPPGMKIQFEALVRESKKPTGTFAKRAKEILKATREGIDQGIFPASILQRENILREYSLYHISTPYEPKSEEEIQFLTEETRELWFHLLNTSKWFVSPRGDMFMAQDDPEFRENEIESVTFRVDTRYPREHKVQLQLEGMDQPVELWLDTNSRLLNSLHEPLAVDATFRLSLTNLLLKRLCLITSGTLSKAGRRGLENSGFDEPNFTYRRANYHILTDPRYTMTSAGVNAHADEIYEDYGINIFDERERRRRLGVIGPTDHLTFNRESTPDVMPENPRPNVVIYKPELLSQYLNSNRNTTME